MLLGFCVCVCVFNLEDAGSSGHTLQDAGLIAVLEEDGSVVVDILHLDKHSGRSCPPAACWTIVYVQEYHSHTSTATAIQVNVNARIDARKLKYSWVYCGLKPKNKKSSKCEAYHYNKYKNGSGSALICNIKRSINLQRTEKKPKIACCKRERLGHCWLIKTSFSAAYELGQYVEFSSCTVTLSLPLLPSLVSVHPIADKAPWLTGLQNRKTSEFLFFFFQTGTKAVEQ